jgi:hypothetical protein
MGVLENVCLHCIWGVGWNILYRTVTIYCILANVVNRYTALLYITRAQEKPRASSPSEKCARGVLDRCVMLLSSLYCTVLMCTPCWTGVRSGELTLLEFIAQTESKYLNHGASKDIGTVRNMMNWVWPVLLLQGCEVKCVLAIKRGKVFSQMCGVYYIQYSGCMYARHDDTRHEMT